MSDRLTVRVRGGRALHGTLTTPGDKSISHRALLLGALGEGVSRIRGLSDGADVAHSAAAIELLGVGVRTEGDEVVIDGGRERLDVPVSAIDCGNAGTGLRLLAGMVATVPGTTTLTGDASLSARPMDRIAEPLRLMGAEVRGRTERCLPPIEVTGGALRGIEWDARVPSAQVKSAILLAGLGARGDTVVREAVATRAHTEEMLAARGVDIEVTPYGQGSEIRLRPGPVAPADTLVPGDPSQAAFWVVAGCIVEGSDVALDHVYDGPARLGFLDVLGRMGAVLDCTPSAGGVRIRATAGPLRATEVAAAEIPSLDEVPILAVAAATAHGTTVFRDVGELRVKESDRLVATARLVEAFGAAARIEGDALVVDGRGGPLAHGRVDSDGDHRMAMAGAVAALAAGAGDSVIEGADAVATSYPGFFADLGALAGPGSWEVVSG